MFRPRESGKVNTRQPGAGAEDVESRGALATAAWTSENSAAESQRAADLGTCESFGFCYTC